MLTMNLEKLFKKINISAIKILQYIIQKWLTMLIQRLFFIILLPLCVRNAYKLDLK